jgi:hypothetical protein
MRVANFGKSRSNLTMSQIKFRYRRNRMLTIGGESYLIPVKPARVREVRGWSNGQPAHALFHDFDMAYEHTVSLPSCSPQPVRKREDWSPEFHAKVQERAMEAALEARERVAQIRQDILHHVSVGNIEVTEDLDNVLEDDSFVLSDAEKAVIGKNEKQPPKRPALMKPSEIAKAAKGK